MKGDIKRDEVIGWDGKPLPPLPDVETFARENPGAIMVRRGPVPEPFLRAVENALIGIDAAETLTEDQKFALGYKAGATIHCDYDGKVSLVPPCGFTRIDGKWHVAVGNPSAILNPPSSP